MPCVMHRKAKIACHKEQLNNTSHGQHGWSSSTLHSAAPLQMGSEKTLTYKHNVHQTILDTQKITTRIYKQMATSSYISIYIHLFINTGIKQREPHPRFSTFLFTFVCRLYLWEAGLAVGQPRENKRTAWTNSNVHIHSSQNDPQLGK